MDKHRNGRPRGQKTQGDEDLQTIGLSASAASAGSSSGRRTSRSASHGAARAESWMARVSTAMSHRLFSAGGNHGKRIGGSRNTQVKPMDPAADQGRSGDGTMGRAASSSENSCWTVPQVPTGSWGSVTAATAVEDGADGADGADDVDACPSVACDVESSEDEDGRTDDRKSVGRRRERTEWAAKVAPARHDNAAFAYDDEPRDDPVRVVLSGGPRPVRIRNYADEVDDAEEEDATLTPAVLQGFFRRSPSLGVELRDQQRRARREAHYRRIRERQDELRGRVGREDASASAAEGTAAQDARRRLMAQQLGRVHAAQRLALRREAAAARELVLSRVAAQDARAFRSARERWEREFEDEVRMLSQALRRARVGARAADERGDERPATVAGLAVPEALAELDRDRRHEDKRVRSAGDSPSPTRMQAARLRTRSLRNDLPEDEVEDEVEDEEGTVGDGADDMEGVAIDVDALLSERARLLRRVDDIDRLVDVQRRIGRVGDQ